ncbi:MULTISPECIES: hypothetical protein [Rufibacter]|uniref:Multidrug efflux pump subunit AcrA (Membrane-fusion protein) n=1 Tax=Rufibacter quisquiliarum TaxID=1549639 RepID=A0A839GLU4_9BACT|nr:MULTISPECIES: hypothetical protein [Rufibacter]MBA9078803.1 multidrug efflux pump subunit AcrA (membrane-fusion protein) [Rufibacter quisquiliarum]
MKKSFTLAFAFGAFLLLSNQSIAQTTEKTEAVSDQRKLEIEARQRAYEEKVVARMEARAEAREAKAAAREARYQRDEAHEAAQIAQRMAKLEAKALRRQEKRNSRNTFTSEAVVK